MDKSFAERKAQLLDDIKLLRGQGDYFRLIDLLENSELDFELCLELIRAYINLSNVIEDNYSLKEKAKLLLDKTAIEGANHALWQFLKGYLLYKQGLYQDSKLRLEHAKKLVSIDNELLFKNINLMLDKIQELELLHDFKGLSLDKKQRLLNFIDTNFGHALPLLSFNGVELYHIAANEKHNYNLLVSVGLSSKKQLNPQGDEESFEICLALPKDFKFNQKDLNPEIQMLIDIVKYLITEKSFVGFGYYLKKDKSFFKGYDYTGAMLSALGDYTKEQQSYKDSNSQTIFFELIPLKPYELAYRQKHNAHELLELFKQNKIRLTPFYVARADIDARIESKQID